MCGVNSESSQPRLSARYASAGLWKRTSWARYTYPASTVRCPVRYGPTRRGGTAFHIGVPGAIAASRSGWVTHAPLHVRAHEYPRSTDCAELMTVISWKVTHSENSLLFAFAKSPHGVTAAG